MANESEAALRIRPGMLVRLRDEPGRLYRVATACYAGGGRAELARPGDPFISASARFDALEPVSRDEILRRWRKATEQAALYAGFLGFAP